MSKDAAEGSNEINNLDETDLIGALDNDEIPKTQLTKPSKMENMEEEKLSPLEESKNVSTLFKPHGSKTQDTYRNLLLEKLL